MLDQRQTMRNPFAGRDLKGESRSDTRPTALAERPAAGPTEVEIRERAYELYLRRQGGPGDPLSDWLSAEQQLQLRSSRE